MKTKYEGKRDEIRRYLERTYFPGRKIPSEKELAAYFGMSLGMVREVLRELEILGIIRKSKRQGNFLNSSVLRTRARLDDNCSFLALISGQGYTVEERAKVRTQIQVPHDREACTFLGNVTRKDLTCFEELYLADGHPAILSYYYCLTYLLGEADWKAIEDNTVALKDRIAGLDKSFNHSVIHLSSVLATEEVAQRLGAREGEPLILWTEAYYNIYDELTGVSYNYMSPMYMDLAFVRKRPN